MVLGHDTLPLGRIIFPAPFCPSKVLDDSQKLAYALKPTQLLPGASCTRRLSASAELPPAPESRQIVPSFFNPLKPWYVGEIKTQSLFVPYCSGMMPGPV